MPEPKNVNIKINNALMPEKIFLFDDGRNEIDWTEFAVGGEKVEYVRADLAHVISSKTQKGEAA